ncbi:MAG: tRNA (N6-isopentenyl adenosine(37)-C2)-methylthiotransferase MiaB [Calditerrivibrio sp.]|nr:tRNA (N6-isopentenyl adenosine(37)-C2)-methylthiotransferase MiaB [Calditerrivibrio sp.]MCA1932703.1 tRNA (N6-isopentenyl adenosine(37)-C2)-methylthiotransferase MiaB [Calditerrivibrio sp.]
MTKKLYIKTFGCQMNEYDTERIISAFEMMGYGMTDDPSEADFAIINTCSVREKPSEKVKSEIGRLKKYKKDNPNFKIGVAGCVAQQEGEAILDSNSYVDMVLGTDGIPRIGEVVERVENGERIAVTEFSSDNFTIPNFSRNRSVSAFVTIMKGCDNFCSYCIVPYVRGREKSRKSIEILDEVKYLVDNGVKEVTFLGQNVNSYGKNLDENINFTQFLYMATKIDGLERIRFVTSHPKDFSGELVDLISSEEKICEYLHLPLQAGSDSVLKKMNRGYSYSEYFEKVSMAKEKIKNIAISSDFIVGFPGEKDDDFLKTLDAIKEIEYETIFAFKYSPRPGTKASDIEDDVSEIVKSQRLKKLLDEQEKITSRLLKSQIGEIQEVMVEGISKKDNKVFSGRNRRNRIVNFVSSKVLKAGDIVNVKILEAKKNSLYGEKI